MDFFDWQIGLFEKCIFGRQNTCLIVYFGLLSCMYFNDFPRALYSITAGGLFSTNTRLNNTIVVCLDSGRTDSEWWQRDGRALRGRVRGARPYDAKRHLLLHAPVLHVSSTPHRPRVFRRLFDVSADTWRSEWVGPVVTAAGTSTSDECRPLRVLLRVPIRTPISNVRQSTRTAFELGQAL